MQRIELHRCETIECLTTGSLYYFILFNGALKISFLNICVSHNIECRISLRNFNYLTMKILLMLICDAQYLENNNIYIYIWGRLYIF